MLNLDWTSIVLGVLTLVGGCEWIVDRRKHKQEVEGLKADNRQKDMELSKQYVTEFRTFIAEPLQKEVSELRQEVKELRDAIQRINDCAYRRECPVLGGLRQHEANGE